MLHFTQEQLITAFFCYSCVFTIISLFFFVHCLKTIWRMKDMIDSLINLIDRTVQFTEKHNDTD